MNKKLVSVLASLSLKELEGLLHFSNNPLFAYGKSERKLLEMMATYFPKMNISDKEQVKMYFSIFKKDFNKNHFNFLQSQTYKLVLDFLAEKNFHKSENKSTFYLKELVEKLPELAEKELKLLSNKSNDYEDYYLEQFQALNLKFDFLLNKSAAERKKLDTSNEKAMYLLDCFYYKNRLKYACEMINVQSILQYPVNLDTFEKDAKYCLESKLKNELPIKLYALSFFLLKNGESKIFEEIKSVLFSEKIEIDKKELKSFFAIAQNFCIRKYNGGEAKYLKELFEIFKKSLERALLSENKQMLSSTYKNIIFVGLKLKAFSWTENFIEKYAHYLPENEKVNALSFSMARYFFAKQEYKKVLEELLQVEYTDVFYQLDAKSLLLKTYYETDEIDTLESLLDSFKILLHRHKKAAPQHIILYKNLINVTRKLISHSATRKDYLKKLQTKISKQAIADKTWVLEKIEELL